MMSHSQNVAHKNANSEKEFMVFPEITPEASLSRHLDKNSFVPCILLGNNRKPGEEDQIPSSSGPSSSGTFKRLAHEEIPKSKNAKKAKIVLLREEFIDLTQDPLIAMVLNQLFYWSQRVNDFGLFLEEEIESSSKINQSAHYGWFYKSAQELVEETMLRVSKVTLRKYLHFLIEKGWVSERKNPLNKWDRVTQYRVNLRILQRDLQKFGWDLPGIPRGTFSGFQVCTLEETREEFQEETLKPASLENHPSKEGFCAFEEKTNEYSKESFLTFEGKDNETSKESFSTFEEKANDTSKIKKVNFIYLTETTSKTTNKEHSQRPQARANFDKMFFEEVLGIWKTYVPQEGPVHLTEEREQKLEFVLALYFQNDVTQWKAFCKRISRSLFLMGRGSRKWRISLDWVLCEENLIKVLEGNFDDVTTFEQKQADQNASDRSKETAPVLAAIEDPLWREWCSGLDFNSRESVSLGELKTIAPARFLEVEEDRLVWIGSTDPHVLSCIEALRLKILPLIQRTFPKARNLRTRVCEDGGGLFAKKNKTLKEITHQSIHQQQENPR